QCHAMAHAAAPLCIHTQKRLLLTHTPLELSGIFCSHANVQSAFQLNGCTWCQIKGMAFRLYAAGQQKQLHILGLAKTKGNGLNAEQVNASPHKKNSMQTGMIFLKKSANRRQIPHPSSERFDSSLTIKNQRKH
uniref:Uncharacterized protein n=1 Tax=Salvator merianae TaxID=96440 RepID=A0A8D0EDY2_SALMN